MLTQHLTQHNTPKCILWSSSSAQKHHTRLAQVICKSSVFINIFSFSLHALWYIARWQTFAHWLTSEDSGIFTFIHDPAYIFLRRCSAADQGVLGNYSDKVEGLAAEALRSLISLTKMQSLDRCFSCFPLSPSSLLPIPPSPPSPLLYPLFLSLCLSLSLPLSLLCVSSAWIALPLAAGEWIIKQGCHTNLSAVGQYLNKSF